MYNFIKNTVLPGIHVDLPMAFFLHNKNNADKFWQKSCEAILVCTRNIWCIGKDWHIQSLFKCVYCDFASIFLRISSYVQPIKKRIHLSKKKGYTYQPCHYFSRWRENLLTDDRDCIPLVIIQTHIRKS